MDISVLISLQCAKKSPKKSEHGKYLKIGEIQDGRQPNSRNMKIVIIIALILLHSCVIYLFVLAFQATCGGNSFKTVKSRKKQNGRHIYLKMLSFGMDVYFVMVAVSKL